MSWQVKIEKRFRSKLKDVRSRFKKMKKELVNEAATFKSNSSGNSVSGISTCDINPLGTRCLPMSPPSILENTIEEDFGAGGPTLRSDQLYETIGWSPNYATIQTSCELLENSQSSQPEDYCMMIRIPEISPVAGYAKVKNFSYPVSMDESLFISTETSSSSSMGSKDSHPNTFPSLPNVIPIAAPPSGCMCAMCTQIGVSFFATPLTTVTPLEDISLVSSESPVYDTVDKLQISDTSLSFLDNLELSSSPSKWPTRAPSETSQLHPLNNSIRRTPVSMGVKIRRSQDTANRLSTDSVSVQHTHEKERDFPAAGYMSDILTQLISQVSPDGSLKSSLKYCSSNRTSVSSITSNLVYEVFPSDASNATHTTASDCNEITVLMISSQHKSPESHYSNKISNHNHPPLSSCASTAASSLDHHNTPVSVARQYVPVNTPVTSLESSLYSTTPGNSSRESGLSPHTLEDSSDNGSPHLRSFLRPIDSVNKRLGTPTTTLRRRRELALRRRKLRIRSNSNHLLRYCTAKYKRNFENSPVHISR